MEAYYISVNNTIFLNILPLICGLCALLSFMCFCANKDSNDKPYEGAKQKEIQMDNVKI